MEEEKQRSTTPVEDKKKGAKGKKEVKDDISEEDQKLKDNIDLWVVRIQDVSAEVALAALR